MDLASQINYATQQMLTNRSQPWVLYNNTVLLDSLKNKQVVIGIAKSNGFHVPIKIFHMYSLLPTIPTLCDLLIGIPELYSHICCNWSIEEINELITISHAQLNAIERYHSAHSMLYINHHDKNYFECLKTKIFIGSENHAQRLKDLAFEILSSSYQNPKELCNNNILLSLMKHPRIFHYIIDNHHKIIKCKLLSELQDRQNYLNQGNVNHNDHLDFFSVQLIDLYNEMLISSTGIYRYIQHSWQQAEFNSLITKLQSLTVMPSELNNYQQQFSNTLEYVTTHYGKLINNNQSNHSILQQTASYFKRLFRPSP